MSSAPDMPPASGGSAGKKKGGGFLHRQAKAKKATSGIGEMITEEELLQKDVVTPEDVLKLTNCTESESLLNYAGCHCH